MKYNKMASTPTQRERLSADQAENNAGGFVYEISNIDRLRRFLILGTEGGTYYAAQGDHTRQALTFLATMAASEPVHYWGTLLEVATENLAPRHSTVLYALAVLRRNLSDSDLRPDHAVVRKAIGESFTRIVRTGTHLFEYADYENSLGGWGRNLRTLIGSWYLNQDADRLAYHGVKYRQRGGWSHRDLLRKAHPKATDPTLRAVIDYLAHGATPVPHELPEVIQQFEAVRRGELSPLAADALTWEMLPTDALASPEVWRALIDQGRIPLTATMRNLGRMTSNGAFEDVDLLVKVAERLGDADQVSTARIHPFNVLTAAKTYSSGKGFRGSLSWYPKARIVDSLDDTFRHAFQNVKPTGKRILIALDVSGSMTFTNIMDTNVSPREGSAAMALAMLAGDPDTTDVVAFSSGSRRDPFARNALSFLPMSPRQRLTDAVRTVSGLPFGATDCALPTLWAGAQGRSYDAFVVITDSETHSGQVHPSDALRAYRKQFVRDARMVVVGMTATQFTIADPKDQLSLDIVGFDSSAPRVISDFVAGRF